MEAFQKAAYRLSSFITIDIDTSSPDHNTITLKSLREKLKKETEPTRNLIMGIAFSKTKLQGNE